MSNARRFDEALDELAGIGTAPETRAHEDCLVCEEPISTQDVHAGWGMCGACLHNAMRSGWHPCEHKQAGEEDEWQGRVHRLTD